MHPRYWKRFFSEPASSYFLWGPRGTGKSTWVSRHYQKSLWIDLLDPKVARELSAKPEKLEEWVLADKGTEIIVLDEIQRVPELLTVVHRLIEKKMGWKFVIIASSTRKLIRAGVDLLAGRAVIRFLHPFIVGEVGADFRLEEALEEGMLLLVFEASDSYDVLKSYVATYIYEEVQAEGLMRNMGSFNRFLEAINFSHASVLNTSHIARECEVERKVGTFLY